MTQTINLDSLSSVILNIKKNNKSIVLVGGCFDIIHIGHVQFLQEAKKLGDKLVVLLEADEKVKLLKGKNRPLFTQKERACVLTSIKYIDLIILLPFLKNDGDYDQVILKIKPDIIAVTENDLLLEKKKNQAEKVNAQIKIIPYIKTFSSSKLAELLEME